MTDAVREYREKFGLGSFGRAMAYIPGDIGQQQTSIAKYTDAAIAELEDRVEELDDKLMEAEGAHDAARRWFEEQKKQFARAERAEAERDQARFVADGWHKQFKHAAKSRRAERIRAEKAVAEVALRDRMLELAAESLVRASGRYRPEEEMAKLPEEHMREQRDKTLTHLRARAEKEATATTR